MLQKVSFYRVLFTSLDQVATLLTFILNLFQVD